MENELINIPVSRYEYELPSGLIAQEPLSQRSLSRLLVVQRRTQTLIDAHFSDLPRHIGKNDVLVVNDSRVLHARLQGHRESGGRVEVFLLRRIGEGEWEALINPLSKFRPGDLILLEEGIQILFKFRTEWNGAVVCFKERFDDMAFIEKTGCVPLPPYIKRPYELNDKSRYQTIFAREDGSVAAPTAGLHFDDDLLELLRATGVEILPITLHVGLGTFQPLSGNFLHEHHIHTERYHIPDTTAERLAMAVRDGKRIVAVGTTVTRTLETYARNGKTRGETNLFISPPFEFKLVKALITNFHLPRSSLLVLVHALAGDHIFEAYRHAVEREYRFFSYGDAMLVE